MTCLAWDPVLSGLDGNLGLLGDVGKIMIGFLFNGRRTEF